MAEAQVVEKLIRTLTPKPLREKTLSFYRCAVYQGDRVHCPCCDRSFSGFMPFGQRHIRENAQCPSCNCLERHRTLWMYLRDKTNLLNEPLSVLHVAPESRFAQLLANRSNLDYISADLCSPHAMVHLDITDIPMADNLFDVILCNHVLEHVQDDRKAMDELYRVLRPGGWAILQSPVDMSLSETLEEGWINTPQLCKQYYGQSDHLRLYGSDYSGRLRSAGFQVDCIPFSELFTDDQARRYALGRQDIYHCRK